MKLYFTPGVCSLAPHIALREAGAEFVLVQVDLQTKQTADGDDYLALNRSGKVPALDFGESEVLTENAAILQYIADRFPEAQLAPPVGTTARYRLQSRLSYLGSELHKLFGPLFIPGHSEDAKQASIAKIHDHLAALDSELAARDYLLESGFSVADAYLFTILGWPHLVGVEIDQYTNLGAYAGRIAARASVQAALATEGLI